MEQLTITVQMAGEVLGLGSTKLYELLASGELTRVKIGRRTLVTTESIRALVNGCADLAPAALNDR